MTSVVVSLGNIVTLGADAIVNAANNSLRGGGGVDGAIHQAAGPELLAECVAKYPEGCPTGEARITSGYNLSAKHVIHTVGPIYGEEGGKEAQLLASCYTNSLQLAAENGLKLIGFPCISTGVYGYPKKEAARIAVGAVKGFLKEHPDTSLKVIAFVCLNGGENYDALQHFLKAE